MEEKARILIIEDEMLTAKSIEKSLHSLGYEVAGIASSYTDGLEKIIDLDPDLVLMDIKLKGTKDGIELTEQITKNRDVPIIFLTAHADAKTVARAYHTNLYGYLVKPYSERELYETIQLALGRHKFKKTSNK